MTSSQARLPLQIFFSLWSGKYGHTLETSTILPEAASLWLSPICHKSSFGSAASRDLNLLPSAAQENPAVSPYKEAEERSARSRIRCWDTKGTFLVWEGVQLCAEILCSNQNFRRGGSKLFTEHLSCIIWKWGWIQLFFLKTGKDRSAVPGYLLLDEHHQTSVRFTGGLSRCTKDWTPEGTDLPLSPSDLAKPQTSSSEGLILLFDHHQSRYWALF